MTEEGIFLGGGVSSNILIKSSAPNIKAEANGLDRAQSWNCTLSGSFEGDLYGGNFLYGGSGAGNPWRNIRFNAKLSSPVYKDGLDRLYPHHYVVEYWIKYK